MAQLRGVFSQEETQSFIRELQRTPDVMKKVLEGRQEIHKLANKVLEAKDLFMIGRGLDYGRCSSDTGKINVKRAVKYQGGTVKRCGHRALYQGKSCKRYRPCI